MINSKSTKLLEITVTVDIITFVIRSFVYSVPTVYHV